MTDHAAIAAELTRALGLRLPPIAVSLTDSAPDSVPAFEGAVAAGCVFWERAATGAFQTSPADHASCAIGMYTHAMPLAGEPEAELKTVLGVLGDMGYVRPEDIPAIPVAKKAAKKVVYAPLASAPVAPDVVLLFADARQSLVITEAAQQISDGAPPALGRPACAIVPQVMNSGGVALSLGCCGARAYLDALTDDVALWGVPAAQLARFTERVTALASANTTLGRFHELRREDVAAGKRPTVQQSLARLQGATS